MIVKVLAILLVQVVVKQVVTQPVPEDVIRDVIQLAQVPVQVNPVLQVAPDAQGHAQVVKVVDQDVRRVVVPDAREVVKVPAMVVKVVDQVVRLHAQVAVAEPAILLVRIPVLPIALITALAVARDNVKGVPRAPEDVDQAVPDAQPLVRINVQAVVAPAIILAPQLARQNAVQHAIRPAHQPAWAWN